MCPRCGQHAPIVYRGIVGYCTACGQSRVPLSASSLGLAGATQKVSGTVAKVFAWIVLGVGLSSALFLFLFLNWLFPGGPASLIASLPVALVTLTIWAISIAGGRSLKQSGETSAQNARESAVFGLAQTRGGRLDVATTAQLLGISFQDADGLLTSMAKRIPDEVAVDLDADGALVYRFPRIDMAKVRVEETTGSAPGEETYVSSAEKQMRR